MSHMKLSRRKLLKTTIRSVVGSMAIPYIITGSATGSERRPVAGNRITVGMIGVGGAWNGS